MVRWRGLSETSPRHVCDRCDRLRRPGLRLPGLGPCEYSRAGGRAESLIGARASVVDLVRIQHDHPPWSTRMDRAPVVEDLDAGGGHTDRIRVVAMFLIGLASEPCAEELDAIGWPRADEPPRDRALARSFKTLAGRSGLF